MHGNLTINFLLKSKGAHNNMIKTLLKIFYYIV